MPEIEMILLDHLHASEKLKLKPELKKLIRKNYNILSKDDKSKLEYKQIFLVL